MFSIAVGVAVTVLLDVTPYSLVSMYICFGDTGSLHLQGKKIPLSTIHLILQYVPVRCNLLMVRFSTRKPPLKCSPRFL